MTVTRIGTRELKNHLSEILRRVKAGEMVIITERGKPVGQITPYQADLNGRMQKLVEAGIVEWNGKAVPPHQPKAVNRGNRLMSDLVAEDRE
jgi:prevent-host-death family protein